MFNESKGVRIEVINPSVRMVSPQLAVEEGTVRVIRPSAGGAHRRPRRPRSARLNLAQQSDLERAVSGPAVAAHPRLAGSSVTGSDHLYQHMRTPLDHDHDH